MAQLEPMDVDDINDNKENAFVPNNALRGQENSEVLDSSEYLMKLRYSTTPVCSPMSKSYTVIADKNIDDANKCNMTQSLNLTVTKPDTTFTGPKSLPLQTIPSEDAADKTINVLKQLDSLISDNGDVTITVSNALDDEENVSLPSSASVTPEAVTPTKENPKPIGSPILRGIQSVFNMFRASQSPVSPCDDEEHAAEVKRSLESSVVDIENSLTASTPLNIHKKSESVSSRDSRERESTIFNEKLEKDLEWNETTIIFSKEKFPIHKLLFQQSSAGPLPNSSTIDDVSMASVNLSYEAMDVSCNDSGLYNKTLQGNNVTSTQITENVQSYEITGSEKDESVFLDCETTLNESQAKNIDKSNSRTQDKTLNDTSFISVQSAETVTCTSDMAENLIVSESFVQENRDINPIQDNSALEKPADTVSHTNSFNIEHNQGSYKITVESLITKTSDEINKQPVETNKSTIEEKVFPCPVNVLDEKVTVSLTTQYDVSTEECIQESQVIESQIQISDANERNKQSDKNTVIQGQVNIRDEVHTNVNVEHQYNISSIEYAQEAHEKIIDSYITQSSDQSYIHLKETNIITIDDAVQSQAISNEELIEENLSQFDCKTKFVSNEAASLVCTDSNISQSELLCSLSDAKKDFADDRISIHLKSIDSLENNELNTDEQMKLKEGRSENQSFGVSIRSEPNVLVGEDIVSQCIKESGPISLVNDLKPNVISEENIVTSTQDAPIDTPSTNIKYDADTTIDMLNIPAVVDIKPDGSLVITTDDKESFEIPTTEEDISMVNADMLVPGDEQDEDLSNENDAQNREEISEEGLSAACVSSQRSETLNRRTEMRKLLEDQCKDEEIVISESNSPYVSLGAEATETESVKENIITSSEVKSTPPESPKITSAGYNFNFDEVNPFATKTRLSISPTRQLSSPGKLAKSPVFSQIMESFPNISEDTPANISVITNIFNKSDSVTSQARSTIISKDEIIKAETLMTDNDNKCKEELIPVPSKLLNKKCNESNLELIPNNELIMKSQALTVVPTTISNEKSKESNAQIISTSSKFYSMGVSSSDIDETIHYSGNNKANESLQSSQNDSIANDVNREVYSQLPAEQEDKKVEAFQAQPEHLNKTFDSPIENTANITEVPDNVSDLSVACSDDKNDTVREVLTEDEDTAEGPYIESQIDLKDDCFSGFVSVKSDCGTFDDLPPEAKDEAFEPVESAEMFIDAEAFDFLMSQNRSNEVTSSGKESLFLKFDPLFAKRVNSDGVLDILSKVQKRQSTPKKLKLHQSIMDMSNEEKPGPSNGDRTFDMQGHDTTMNTRPKPQIGDFDESLNEPYPKPTMIVTPVVPKNNMKTPSRSIRRSSGVHSPAIAVIDRLLSISANNSMAYDDTTVIHYNAEQEEADRALIELRDLVAVKELEVYQLKSEGKELKDRLFTLESHMENLDREGEKRLKAINALNQQLNEKDKMNKSMKDVVEEYEKTIAGLISEIETDKKRNAEEKMQLIRDRDEQTAHLANMEGAFSDLHSKYEKSKQIILSYKANEDAYKKSIEDFEASLIKMEKNYDALKEHATAQLDHANQELEKINKSHESEVVKLKAMIKRKDLHITSLEENIAQKIKANEELTAICDELISKVG